MPSGNGRVQTLADLKQDLPRIHQLGARKRMAELIVRLGKCTDDAREYARRVAADPGNVE